MTHFKTSKAELLFIKTYSEVNTANLQKLRSSWIHFFADGIIVETNILPQGNWQLIGKLSEVSEEVANGLVDKLGSFKTKYEKHSFYRNYMRGVPQPVDMTFTTAIESLTSIATHLGMELTDNIYILKRK